MADGSAAAVTQDKTAQRFETIVDGHTAFLEYDLASDFLTLIHTEVPKELAGKGIGGKLADAALEYARNAHLKVVPLCRFVAAYIRRHPEYLNLVPEKQRHRVSGDAER